MVLNDHGQPELTHLLTQINTELHNAQVLNWAAYILRPSLYPDSPILLALGDHALGHVTKAKRLTDEALKLADEWSAQPPGQDLLDEEHYAD